jgi:hypothetical protein
MYARSLKGQSYFNFREVSWSRDGAFISCLFALQHLAERREEEYRDSHEIRLDDGSQGGARFYDSSFTISVVGRKIRDIWSCVFLAFIRNSSLLSAHLGIVSKVEL